MSHNLSHCTSHRVKTQSYISPLSVPCRLLPVIHCLSSTTTSSGAVVTTFLSPFCHSRPKKWVSHLGKGDDFIWGMLSSVSPGSLLSCARHEATLKRPHCIKTRRMMRMPPDLGISYLLWLFPSSLPNVIRFSDVQAERRCCCDTSGQHLFILWLGRKEGRKGKSEVSVYWTLRSLNFLTSLQLNTGFLY